MSPHSFAAAAISRPATSRRFVAGVLASLALTALCAALIPASASAIPRQFAGMQSWNEPSESDFELLKRGARVRMYRIQFSWASVEPNEPTDCTDSECSTHDYRWGRYDQMFERAASKGVRLVPVLLGTPKWASPDQRWLPTYSKNWSNSDGRGYKAWQRQSYYDFAEAATKRYGRNGTFWEGKSYGMGVRARYWQIHNEPNLPNYWWNKPSVNQYAQLLKGTSAALKAGDRTAKPITAGLPWTDKATIQPPQFLKKLFSEPATGKATNFVAIHPYARNPDLVIEGVRQTRAALNGSSARTRPIWLTEFGWADSGPNSAFTVSESTQARYLRETYRKLLAVRKSYKVKGAIWFNLVNVRRSPGAWYYHTGLFTSRGRAKDSWYALKCVTKGGSENCSYGR